MNSANNGINETLKRKNNTIYPEVHGVIDKRKAIANNYDKNKTKQKFNFITTANSEINSNRNSSKKKQKPENFPVTKSQNHSVSQFNLSNVSRNVGASSGFSIPKIANSRHVEMNNPNNKAFRSFSLNKIKTISSSNLNKNQSNALSERENKNIDLKIRAISEAPESKESKNIKMANHPLINTKEMLSDYWSCGGILNNLRQRIKTKKKSMNAENESDVKENIEQIKVHIQTANNYINSIYTNYREKFRSSVENSANCTLEDINGKLTISEENELSLNKSEIYQIADKQHHFKTEPKINNFDDSSSKLRRSLPKSLQYSAELNAFFSTETSDSQRVDELDKNHDDKMFVDKVNKFSFDCDEEKLETYYKEKKDIEDLNNENHTILNKEEINAIEIINSKIKEEENELRFVVENFDIFIDHDMKRKEDKDKLLKEYAENQLLLMKKLAHLEATLKKKTNENESMSLSLQELMRELDRGESHRRKLHNYIQELRGNIRVFCRVKPNTDEKVEDQTQINSIVRYPELSCTNNGNLETTNKNNNSHVLYSVELINREANSSNNASSIFHFDRIFTEISSQKEEIKPFIQSALDGENVCIFAYGATGSGKTYTMQGPSWSLDNRELAINEFSGILPRAAIYIFEELTRLNMINYSCKVSISAIEIYNENIFDLFDNSSNKQPLQIFYNKNVVQLKNLIWHQINKKEDVIKYTKEASETRRSDNTKYNENSSRSHAIYQLKLEFSKNQKQIESYINIIDLAGSERCSITSFNNKSKEEIETMKKLQNESNFINKSLTTLGRIISMLADKKMSKMAIPYRESKLSMILQNSLKTTSKTAMIVTICSDLASLQQNRETLKFATNAMVAC